MSVSHADDASSGIAPAGRDVAQADLSTGSIPSPDLRHGAGQGYRPTIDGLRTIAVAAVVLYHFGLTSLSGGFVGVDVFFVLSGFLIGGQLYSEWRATGRIRLGAFWLRRIRRLAPAFILMAGLTAFATWFILLPADLRDFGRSLVAAATWLSNVQFWREAGYFDTASELKPLLHTWSLSVEEQFYLVIPLLCLALGRIKGWGAGLAVAWVLSFAACLWLTRLSPSAAFFLFPMRAWEMLTGVILAVFLVNRPDARGPWWAAAFGLAFIVWSLVAARAGTGFPGWQAVLPVLGTALVLWARDIGPVAKVLAHPAPVALGLVSYSLYLWHWPVAVLSRYWRGGWGSAGEAALWCALSLAMAVIAWACVERPLRRASLSARGLVTGFVAGVAVLIGLGLWFWRSDGLPDRFGPFARAHIAASQDFLQDWSRCRTPASGLFVDVEICPIGPEVPLDNIGKIYWGDSHLRALMDGLAATTTEPALIIWHAGCPPFVGVGKTESAATPAEDAACQRANAEIVASLRALGPDDVIFVGRWRYYAEGRGIGRDAYNLISLNGGDYVSAWDAIVASLSPHVGRITVLRQVPELPHYDAGEVARALVFGRLTPELAAARGSVDMATASATMAGADAPLLALAEQGAIRFVDPWPALCAPLCDALPDGVQTGLYFDNNHLTNAGAMRIAQFLRAEGVIR